MPKWCTGIPVLVHWATIAVLRMAAVGFAFALLCECSVCVVYMCMCTCVHLCLCVCRCVHVINDTKVL